MQSLQNHFIIAMPTLKDPIFERSVTYICEHDEEGAMGIVVNQPTNMSVSDLLTQISIETDDKIISADKMVFAGGPVKQDRGFVIHPQQLGWNSSMRVAENMMVTTSKDILKAIGTEAGPSDYLLALGYAGWSAGQLEEELQENNWLTIQADPKILFNTPISERWQTATEGLGFNPWQLSEEIGHA